MRCIAAFILGVILTLIIWYLSKALDDSFRTLASKHAQYNCDNCSVLDCPVHECKCRKEKL